MDNNIKKEEFKIRLNELLKENDITPEKLGEKLSLSKSTIYRYINGEMLPKVTTIIFIAQLFNVNYTWLMGFDVAKKVENPYIKKSSIKIPVLNYVKSGEPFLVKENIINYEELPEDEFNDGEYFGLKINDHSMFPRILEDDVVIVKQQNDCDNGQVAVILVNDDKAIVKQVKKIKNGIMLISFNNNYEPIFFTNDEIKNKKVRIIGVVKRLIGYNFG